MSDWISLNDWQQLPAQPGIYSIRHRDTGREYVGQSKDVRSRIASHRYARSWHYFGRAVRKYGCAAFDVCLVALGAPEDLGQLEQDAIASRGTLVPHGFNLAAGGLGPTGVTWSYERRQAQSISRTGIRQTEEAKAKMREARLKYNGFKGKKHTAEAKAKMAAAAVALHTGRKRSDETKARISASLVGRAAPVLSAEARERIAAAHRGKPKPGSAQPGEKNGMYGKVGTLTGKKGSAHPASRSVGIWVPDSMTPITVTSMTEAAAWAGMSIRQMTDLCLGKRRARSGILFAYL